MASQESMMIRQGLKAYMASRKPNQTIEEARMGLEGLMSMVPRQDDIKVQEFSIEGIPAEWVMAPNALEERVLLYVHGGAYIMGSCNTHRDLAGKLSRATASRVLLFEYRLAPEHPYPAGLNDALAVYRWLVSSGVSPERIVVGGDSAGGGLTMGMLLKLRDAGETLPSATFLISPWTDLEGTGESMETRAEVDPFLNPIESRMAPVLYIGHMDRRDPIVSPIYADLKGLPPMLVHVGNDEILLDDSIRLVERASEAGIEVDFKVWDDMWHVFHQFAIPEAQLAIQEIGQYVVQRFEQITPVEK
jgi:epsilon-lactone hydrolase